MNDPTYPESGDSAIPSSTPTPASPSPASSLNPSAPAPDSSAPAPESSAPATDSPAPAPASAAEASPQDVIEELHRTGPAFGVGSIITHPSFGRGRIQGYEGRAYIILFKGGDLRTVSFDYAGMKAEEREGDPELDLIKEAVRDVLSDYGWIDSGIELGARWQGGAVVLEPGKTGTQAKEIPMDVFFKKIIGIREKLRVLEQKINNHKKLDEEDKVELQGYITRSYGSLTTFNSLFADKSSYFKGSGK